ncbi:hypothetical protein DFH06DRAFT_1113421 [Mycena polygramma]|nr:hypothetical protein DFH06DRAFT_1113421 [Mycena polygramma]
MDVPSEFLTEPRVDIQGLETRTGFALPSLTSVRADAVRSRDMRNRPEDYTRTPFVFPPGSLATIEPRLRLGLIFNAQLPNLFTFSYFVQDADAPEDIVDDCIWALAHLIDLMEECFESVLESVLVHVKRNCDYQNLKYIALLNARLKLALYLTRAGRAQEAVPYTKSMVEEECSGMVNPWLHNPMPFQIHGEVLVLTRTDDREAVEVLRRALVGIETLSSLGLPALLRGRVFLSRALRNIGADDEAQTHEKWLINWFRKNPRVLRPKNLEYFLLPPGPILDGLGGEAWLENRPQTFKSAQRQVKACKTCGAREPVIKLMQCNNCKYIFYCSKQCQRAHWKAHKVECRERVAAQEKIERMRLTDPSGAKRAEDWSLWCNSNHYATQMGMIHALGLHRDPRRGRTHIVVKHVEYIPAATKLQHKFHVASCGVFRIEDVLRDVEAIMNLDHDEGQEYVDSICYDPAGRPGRVPFITLAFGTGITRIRIRTSVSSHLKLES